MRSRAIVAALFLALLPLGAKAQNQPPIGVAQVWLPQSRLASSVAVTSTSSATQLPALGQVAWICNTGTADAFLIFGTSGSIVASVTTGTWLKSGICIGYSLVPNPGSFSPVYSYVAAVTASAPTTIMIETGLGTPPLLQGIL